MTPDIRRTIAQTWTHLCTRTLVRHAADSTAARPEFVPLEPREAVAILKDPVVRAVEERVNRMALSGDVIATQLACQHWNTACKKALKDSKIV